MSNPHQLPKLKYSGNEKKKLSLHLIFQIMGKIRMGLTPRKNHWWYITLYVTEKGFSTGPVPLENGFESFSLSLDVLHNRIEILKSNGDLRLLELRNGLTIADSYKQLIRQLEDIGIKSKHIPKPFDLNITKEFSEIETIHHYDPAYVMNFWKVFLWVDSVFKEFSGRFYGKTCPVHLYWHSMDLAVTRFSGKEAPAMPPEARLSDKDAYSHECISFGFWAGDENIPEPAFYSYTYPAPDNLEKETLKPKEAEWVINNGSPMALFKLSDLLDKDNPKAELLNFMESSYRAGAKLAGWDIEKLTVPSLTKL